MYIKYLRVPRYICIRGLCACASLYAIFECSTGFKCTLTISMRINRSIWIIYLLSMFCNRFQCYYFVLGLFVGFVRSFSILFTSLLHFVYFLGLSLIWMAHKRQQRHCHSIKLKLQNNYVAIQDFPFLPISLTMLLLPQFSLSHLSSHFDLHEATKKTASQWFYSILSRKKTMMDRLMKKR